MQLAGIYQAYERACNLPGIYLIYYIFAYTCYVCGVYQDRSGQLFAALLNCNSNSSAYGLVHQWLRVRAGPTAIWPTLNSPKIAGIQYYSVLNIIIFNYIMFYNVL